jgi:hypothetical protein
MILKLLRLPGWEQSGFCAAAFLQMFYGKPARSPFIATPRIFLLNTIARR